MSEAIIDPRGVRRWLDAYNQAWETYAPEHIRALFTEDAEYRWHPWDEGDDVARGHDQIVQAWLHNPDTHGTYKGTYEPLLVHEDTAIATGTSVYYTDPGQATIDRTYHNIWVLRFSPDGRCSSFTEWYMREPDAEDG